MKSWLPPGRGTNSARSGRAMPSPDRPAIFRWGWLKTFPEPSDMTRLGSSKLATSRHRKPKVCIGVRGKGNFLPGEADQEGYFRSPLDFLRFFLTFFLFKAAFNRFVLPVRFMETSLILGILYGILCNAPGALKKAHRFPGADDHRGRT